VTSAGRGRAPGGSRRRQQEISQLALSAEKSLPLHAGQIAAPLGAGSFFMGEARRKRLQVTYEKHRNTQLAAAAPELKVP